MSVPKISVIVPNYNHSSYLKERLDSIFNQTFQDFEVLILDDASTDNSIDLLKTYANHPKVSHFIINDQNSGSPFGQWPKGITLARGEYIWIAETDDFAESTFLEKNIDMMKSNPVLTLTYTDSQIVNTKGESIGLSSIVKNKFFKTERWSHDYENNGLEEVLDYILQKVTINNVSAVLFRKKDLLKIDLNLLSLFKNVGDFYAYCHILFQGSIGYIALPLNNYRSHGMNITKANVGSGLFYNDALKGYDAIFDTLISKDLKSSQKKQLGKNYKYFIYKFGFHLVDFGFGNCLKHFILKLSNHRAISKFEARFIILAFSLYKSNNIRIRHHIRKILKKLLI